MAERSKNKINIFYKASEEESSTRNQAKIIALLLMNLKCTRRHSDQFIWQITKIENTGMQKISYELTSDNHFGEI